MSFWWGRGRAGVSLFEVLVAVGASAIVLLAIGSFIASTSSATSKAKDRAFAQGKATQILEEILAYKTTGPTDDISKFDAEGLQFRLTTANVAANDTLSGNPARSAGFYKYVRIVDILPVTGDANSRQVDVKIYYAKRNATPTIEGTKPLAVATGMVRAGQISAGGVQVVNVYALSIENVPHVYRDDSDSNHQYQPSAREARLAFEKSLARVEASNPWLRYKITYIQRMSIGRDPRYRPYMNDAKPIHGTSSTRDPLNYAYFYPGKIGSAYGFTTYYYNPGDIKGQLQVDRGTITNQGDYPLADQFNHCVQFPDEFENDDPHAPYGNPDPVADSPASYNSTYSNVSHLSLREFLEDLETDTTGKYRNAMLVNLHGEVFPALPLRPWADPAKMPQETDALTRERRLVTHPYKQVFATNERVSLLTHMYMDNGAFMPSVTGNDANIYNTWATDHNGAQGAIVIKDIKSYIADDSLLSLDGTADYDDMKISVIQKERTDTTTSNAKYVLKESWPVSIGGVLLGESPLLGGRKNHSGPHVTLHNNSNGHGHSSSKPAHHDPEWGDHSHFPAELGATANDIVIKLADLDFDARQVTDGSNVYGIKSSATAYDRDHTLYGRAYIPDPYLPFLSTPSGTSAVTEARNTARIITELKLKSNAIGKRFEVQTILWDDNTDKASVIPEGRSSCYFYYGLDWDDTRKLYWDATKNRPAIPWTEQVQTVGDPRHNPYLDARYRQTYNPYFSNFKQGQRVYAKDEVTNLASDPTKCLDDVNPLIPASYPSHTPPSISPAYDGSFPNTANDWNGVKYNVPAYFRMWRTALMRNGMTFVSLTGEPLSMLGLGGEFQLHGQVDSVDAMTVSCKPWIVGTGDAGLEAGELFYNTTHGRPYIVRSNASNVLIWTSVPWLGELYPAHAYFSTTNATKWGSKGNLPSGRGVNDVYYRENLQHLPDNTWSYQTNKDNTVDGAKLLNNQGLVAFLNGTLAAGGSPLDVNESGTATATQTSTGAGAVASLRMNVLSTEQAKYSYAISGGAITPEWNIPPYSTKVGIDWLLPSTVTPQLYYSHASAPTTSAAIAPIVMKNVFTGAPTQIAVVVPSTLRSRSWTQIPDMLDVVNVSALEAFFDATRIGLGAGNVKGLPRVRMTLPKPNTSLASRTVGLEWYGKWTRADGRPYSAFFPDGHTYPFNPSSGEPLDSVFFVKFRALPSGTWSTAKLTAPSSSAAVLSYDGDPSYATTVNPIATVANPTAGAPYATKNTATWDASGLAAGPYTLRVEAYNTTNPADRTKTIPGSYAYQEINVTLN